MKIFVAGSINMDLVITTDIMPDNGMTVSGKDFMTNPGGKGANQAVAAAKCGGDVHMIGCVGNQFGRQLVDVLCGYGVNVQNVTHKDNVSSGIAVIIVNNGDNRIILDAGANAYVTQESVQRGLESATKGDLLITQLEIPTQGVVAALKQARKIGMITILNPAPACKLDDEVFALADYFVPNQSETQFYTGIYPDTVEKAQQAARILQNKGVKNVIITMGSRGAAAFSTSGYVQAQAIKVQMVDTTAAGDTFVGAVAVKLCEGATIKEAMEFANRAAAITVTRKGAQQSIPYRGEIDTCEKR